MTEGLAIEIAKQKMMELGVGENYLIRFRHIQLAPLSKLELKGHNELLILIHPDPYLKVYSKAGIYNQKDDGINEMQYMHRGLTVIFNQGTEYYLQVKVLQVIPRLKKI
ncbi:MAG: hypothetical protein JKY09_07455 [Crocinitomicaceae bacterium]|nr:hypothetical protein [Crocinitomicaceae bacterium]